MGVRRDPLQGLHHRSRANPGVAGGPAQARYASRIDRTPRKTSTSGVPGPSRSSSHSPR